MNKQFNLDELLAEAASGPVTDNMKQKYDELMSYLQRVGDTQPLTFEDFVTAQNREIDWNLAEDEYGNVDPGHLLRITPKVLPD